jgi:hypothetical protein
MEANVAKGQIRSNKEIRKPKKSAAAKTAAAPSVSSVFGKGSKMEAKARKR